MGDAKRADGRLVAIVDDDASVRQSMRRLVSSFGFAAEAFGSAEEFLSGGGATRAACLILDVRMPGMDGLELQRQLNDGGRRIPIVFVTARASDDEERRARAAGAVDILRKPVPKDSLLRVLNTILATEAGDEGEGS